MNDGPNDDAGETPIQRALRLKTSALKAKPKTPGGANAKGPRVGGIAAGLSRPATKK